MGAALLSDPDKIEKVSPTLKRSLKCACELELLGAASLPSPEIESLTPPGSGKSLPPIYWVVETALSFTDTPKGKTFFKKSFLFKRLPGDFDMQPDSGTPEPSCSSLGVPEKPRARDMSAESQGPRGLI